MSCASPFARSGPVLVQLALVATGAAILAFWPPREGPILLVALDGRDGGRLVEPALAAGATLAGRGPLRNTILVNGTRATLGSLLSTGMIAVAAPRGLCGSGVTA